MPSIFLQATLHAFACSPCQEQTQGCGQAKNVSLSAKVAELLAGVAAPILYWEQGHEWLFGDPVRFQVCRFFLLMRFRIVPLHFLLVGIFYLINDVSSVSFSLILIPAEAEKYFCLCRLNIITTNRWGNVNRLSLDLLIVES